MSNWRFSIRKQWKVFYLPSYETMDTENIGGN